MASKLFEYAVVYRDPDDDESVILVGPNAMLAKDEAAVRIAAAREAELEDYQKAAHLEIFVRPFA